MSIRPRTALLGAAGCLALTAIVWIAASQIALFRHADQTILLQFLDLHDHGRIAWASEHVAALFDPNPYLFWVVVLVATALLRGRPRVALAAAAIILGANLTTELLKHLVAAPRSGWLFVGGMWPVPPGSWPSGHCTAAMSLVLASVLAAPARLRPAVSALGASLAIAVGYAVMANAMHYPSDVLGGYLVAATWTLGAVGALLSAERRRPSGSTSSARVSIRAALWAPTAVVLAGVALGALVVAVRTHELVAYVRGHEALIVGAAGIAALSLVLSTGVVLSARR
jgi:membrane-associated phospholipid phosphatase